MSLLIYAYVTGTFSSRKIKRVTYDSLANFRKRFGRQFQSAFVQVLQIILEVTSRSS